VNAITDYAPTHFGTGNGIMGKFGSFTLLSGHNVTLSFKAFPAGTSQNMIADTNFVPKLLTLPKVDLSIFDLDTHTAQHSVEFIKVANFKRVFVSKKTELDRSIDGSAVVFKATTVGGGHDNPLDPTRLNDKQMNRAVTVEYEGFSEADVTFGSIGGRDSSAINGMGRRFDFIGRPSILCAEGASDDNKPVTIKQDGEVLEEFCCVLKVGPVQLICAPKNDASWYHFMC